MIQYRYSQSFDMATWRDPVTLCCVVVQSEICHCVPISCYSLLVCMRNYEWHGDTATVLRQMKNAGRCSRPWFGILQRQPRHASPQVMTALALINQTLTRTRSKLHEACNSPTPDVSWAAHEDVQRMGTCFRLLTRSCDLLGATPLHPILVCIHV